MAADATVSELQNIQKTVPRSLGEKMSDTKCCESSVYNPKPLDVKENFPSYLRMDM